MRPNTLIVDTGRWDDYARAISGLGMQIVSRDSHTPRLPVKPRRVIPKPPPPLPPPPPPPKCHAPQILQGGKCVTPYCKPPLILQGNVCVQPPPPPKPKPPVACPDVEIACIGGTIIYGPAPCHTPESCECPKGYTLQAGHCVAPPPPPKPPVIVCATGYTLIKGECVQNPIVCPAGFTLENGVCIETPLKCPSGEYPVDGICEKTAVLCPGGTVDASGNCVPSNAPQPVNGVCPTGWQIDSAGNCTPAGSETNPYSLYLPSSEMGSGLADQNPATPAATGCDPTTQIQDSAGQCFPNTLAGWLQADTLWAGVRNEFVLGGVLGVGVILFLATRGKAKR